MALVRDLQEQFCDVLSQFLEALSITFPECGGVRRLKLEYSMAITHALTPELKQQAQFTLMSKFNEAISPWQEHISNKDERFFLECTSSTLADVNLRDKWLDPSVDGETRDVIWEYCQSLSQTLSMWAMYQGMPEDVLERMQTVAQGLVTPDGGIDLSSLNISDLQSIGESIVGDRTPEEAEAFAKSMLSSATSVLGGSGGSDDAMAAAMSMLGGAGGGGGGAMSAAMSMLGGGGVDLMGLASAAAKK